MNLSAQQIQCEWSNHSKIGSSSITSVISDKENNSYVGGQSFNISFISDTILSDTLYGRFIAKYDSYGNLEWYKMFYVSYISYLPIFIAVDSVGNIFTAISFNGHITIDSNTYSNNDTLLSSFLLTKHNSSGNLQFVKHFKSHQSSFPILVRTDMSENVILLWSTMDSTFVDDLAIGGEGNHFIARMNNNGKIKWLKNLSKNTYVLYGRESMTVDINSSMIFSGNFTDTLNWGNSQIISTPTVTGGFIAKIDSSGNEVWAKKVGSGGIQGEHIICDQKGNIYNCGRAYLMQYFSSTDYADFHNGDCFITHYDQYGNYKCFKRFEPDFYMRSITITDNHIYVSRETDLYFSTTQKPILYKLDSCLQIIDSVMINSHKVSPQSIDTDTNGNILMGGFFQNFLNIDSCSMNSTDPYGSVFFVAKLKFLSNNVSINTPISKEGIIFYPNPTNSYLNIEQSGQSYKASSIKIYDCNGRLVLSQISENNTTKININELKSGIYFIRISDGKNVLSKKFIKI